MKNRRWSNETSNASLYERIAQSRQSLPLVIAGQVRGFSVYREGRTMSQFE
jgi:hypothetical protein